MVYGTRRYKVTFTKGSPIIPILRRVNLISRIDAYKYTYIVLSSMARACSIIWSNNNQLEGLWDQEV